MRAQLNIRLDSERHQRWREHAKQRGITLTALITILVEDDITDRSPQMHPRRSDDDQ